MKKTSLRLFQHTFGAHPEQPLPTGYKGIPFIVGERGIAEMGDMISGCGTQRSEKTSSDRQSRLDHLSKKGVNHHLLQKNHLV